MILKVVTTYLNSYNKLCHDIRNVSVNLFSICKRIAKCQHCAKYIVEINNLCSRMENRLNELAILHKQEQEAIKENESL